MRFFDLERLGFLCVSVCSSGRDSECLRLIQRAGERRGPRLALQGVQMMRVIVANGAW